MKGKRAIHIYAKSCANCYHCKLVSQSNEATCTKGYWYYTSGDNVAKTIMLTEYEQKNKALLSRKILETALKCTEFDNDWA